MSKLTELQIEILTEHYVRSYDKWEAWGDVYEAIERCRNEKSILYLEHYVTKRDNLRK